MAKIIEQVNVGGFVYNIGSTAYAVCDTAANESAKVIQIEGIALVTGLTIHVKFTYANTADNPTLTITGGDSAANNPINIVQYGTTNAGKVAETTGWNTGAIVSLTYDGSKWVKNSGYNTNSQSNYGNITTGGALQTNDITIANGDKLVVTDASDSNKIARASLEFDGSTTTQALTKAGTWQTFNNYSHPTTSGNKHIPSGGSSGQFLGWSADGTAAWVNNPNTDTKIRIYLGNSSTTELPLVGLNSGGSTPAYASHTSGTKDVYGAIPTTVANRATINLSTGALTVPGGIIGNASTATNFASAKSIALTGDVTGSANGGASGGWSISTSIGAGKVTNTMLANKTITIGTTTKELGETFTLAELGISQAMHFKGTTTTTLTDNDTTHTTVTIDDQTYTPNAGDVVLYSDSEFVWTGSKWERLGRDTSYITSYTSYGKISVAGVTGTDAVTANTTQLVAVGGNEAFTFQTGNKWLVAAGTNGTAGNDILTVGHALSGVTAGNYGDSSAQTPGYGSTFNVPYISVDAAGHITSISSHTVKIPASDNTDTKVTQNILATSVTDTYPLLVSAYKTTENTTTATTANRVAAIYVQPSTGKLTATELAGGGTGITSLSSSVVKTALGTDSTTTATFLRKDGNWKTISVKVTANNSGSVVTGVALNAGTQPSFTQGTLASATVTNAVLTLVSQTADTFNKGTYPSLGTISKANLSIDMA